MLIELIEMENQKKENSDIVVEMKEKDNERNYKV